MTAALEPERQIRHASRFVTGFACAGAISCLVDFVLSDGGPWEAWLAAAGLGCASGGLVGSLWFGLLEGPAQARVPRARAIWGVVALGYALWLAMDLGVFVRLGHRNHGLALAGLAASVVVGLGIYGLSWIFGPRPDGSSSAALTGSRTKRWLLRGVLCGLALIAAIVDRSFFPGEHPAAHATLRFAVLSTLGFVVTSFASTRAHSIRDSLGFVATMAAALLPFMIMRGSPAPWAGALFSAPMSGHALTSLRSLSDVDADGFSHVLWGGDCAAWDGEISPGAQDLPGDGIDQDCSGADAVRRAIDPASVPLATKPAPRSVLLITVETLRADHMSLFGYPQKTTPALERRAPALRIYERAYTTGTWTSIAIPTLLRGVFARRLRWEPYFETTKSRMLRARSQPEFLEGERPLHLFMLPESKNPPPLPWWLQRRGMSTAAVVDDRFSELLDPSTGLAAGFDVFVEGDEIEGRDPDDAVVDRAIETLEELSAAQSWFMWVHLFGPHSPSTRHPDSPTFGIGVAAEYDHEIHFVDAQIDRLIDAAIQRDPDVAYILTADHGERLLHSDRMHGFGLTEDEIHVPLVVGGAGLPVGRVGTPVSIVDIVPTIFELTETPAPTYLDGRSLFGEPDEQRLLFSDVWRHRQDGLLLMEMVAAFDGAAKFVFSRTDNAGTLLDPRHPERSPAEVEAAVDSVRYARALHAYLHEGAILSTWSNGQ